MVMRCPKCRKVYMYIHVYIHMYEIEEDIMVVMRCLKCS
jgi:hypothetical protein